MRESIAGTWLFGIVITFIVLFASFLAYSISYTKAFNLKNEIINLIERNDGYTKVGDGKNPYKQIDVTNASDQVLKDNGSVEALAFLRVKNMGYNYSIVDKNNTNDICFDRESGYTGCHRPGGYCTLKVCTTNNNRIKLHYKVTAFIALEIPVINLLIKIPISGETKTMYYDATGNACPKPGDDPCV